MLEIFKNDRNLTLDIWINFKNVSEKCSKCWSRTPIQCYHFTEEVQVNWSMILMFHRIVMNICRHFHKIPDKQNVYDQNDSWIFVHSERKRKEETNEWTSDEMPSVKHLLMLMFSYHRQYTEIKRIIQIRIFWTSKLNALSVFGGRRQFHTSHISCACFHSGNSIVNKCHGKFQSSTLFVDFQLCHIEIHSRRTKAEKNYLTISLIL